MLVRLVHALDVDSLKGYVSTKQILVQRHIEVPTHHLELPFYTRLLNFVEIKLEQRIESLLDNILLLLRWQGQNLWIGLVLVVIVAVLLV